MSKKTIIIVGGGFAGVKCAGTLRRILPRDTADVVLFNSENYMVFQPLLAEVVGASISPESVAMPLRQMLPGVYCRTEDIVKINTGESYVEYSGDRSRIGRMSYNHLVIACGSDVNLNIIPGMADHAYPLRTVGDAIALRYHVMQQMENAEISDLRAERKWYLSFIVVGGGFSGVEVAGEINDLVRETAKYYRNINRDDITVTLIHSRDQILPEVTSSLRDFARKKMEEDGIDVALNKRVTFVTKDGVGFNDGVRVRGATVVCTVGNAPSIVIEKLGARKERGRLVTDPDMRVSGHENVWAIGDCAYIMNAYDNTPSPPTGQFAERQGRQAAQNIARLLEGKETKPFSYRPIGQLCAIGGHNAVAEFMRFHMSGFFAWFFWRSVYLFKLPSISHQIKVGFDWAWEFFYSRDLAHPRIRKTEIISKAYFQAGDYVFRRGDPSNNFYVIESGEVEVLRNSEEGDTEKRLAILGPGDFFGEMALLDHRDRKSSVRVRSDAELTVIGKKIFEQISGALKPFQDFLAEAVKRRGRNLWQKIPAAYNLLAERDLDIFIEPLLITLSPESTFEEAVNTLCAQNLDFCCVLEDDRLLGILTRTDIFTAVEHGVRPHSKVSEFMNAHPVVVTENDSCTVVAATMREHDLKWVPVVDNLSMLQVKGYIRRDKLIEYVMLNLHRAHDSLTAGGTDKNKTTGS